MACLLFYGPGAREAALERSEEVGRLLVPPIGDNGLKVAEAREVVSLLSSTAVGDQIGVVVVGPMDEGTSEALDALLKVLEEHDERYVCPILWAHDAGDIIGTIRSRCIERWCPGTTSPESAFVTIAESLCQSALRRRTAGVIETLNEHKGSEDMLLRAAPQVLVEKTDWPLSARLKLWASLREPLQRRNPSRLEILAAFLV